MTEPGKILSVGLVAPQDPLTDGICQALQQYPIKIALYKAPEQLTQEDIQSSDFDIWLLSIDDDSWTDDIDTLLEQEQIPCFFNEHTTLNSDTDWGLWGKRLVRRLQDLVKDNDRLQQQADSNAEYTVEITDDLSAATQKQTASNDDRNSHAEVKPLDFELWILGSSMGGPAAVKTFFDHLPKCELPVAFILVQHIDQGHLTTLQKILASSASHLKVSVVSSSEFFQPGKLIIAPFSQRLTFVPNGLVAVSNDSWTRPFAPNVNNVITDMAACYPSTAGGVIIFSGMSDDGSEGLPVAHDINWQLWAQTAQSSSNSSMPDAARATGFINFSGTPEQLAGRFYQYMAARYLKHLA